MNDIYPAARGNVVESESKLTIIFIIKRCPKEAKRFTTKCATPIGYQSAT